jgi:hypothetical protein
MHYKHMETICHSRQRATGMANSTMTLIRQTNLLLIQTFVQFLHRHLCLLVFSQEFEYHMQIGIVVLV